MNTIYIYIMFTYCFKRDHGYRIKISGKDELYLIATEEKVRLINSNDLEMFDNLTSVATLDKSNTGGYFINFCGRYVGTKDSDPGIILRNYTSDNSTWDIVRSPNGFFLVNKDKCLTKTHDFDSSTKGFYMNSLPCNSGQPNEFSILDSGNKAFFCDKEAEKLCRNKDFRYPYENSLYPNENSRYPNENNRYSDKDDFYPDRNRGPRKNPRFREDGTPIDDDYYPDDGFNYPRSASSPNFSRSNHEKINDMGPYLTHHGRETEHDYHHND